MVVLVEDMEMHMAVDLVDMEAVVLVLLQVVLPVVIGQVGHMGLEVVLMEDMVLVSLVDMVEDTVVV